ncbi:hypothetical protein NM208_g860 [Fusarium decemcellulare]|uniref:Uncharacterized protein n=1 Tax=Fusarium decemcellulare TaxID=57161 RepID=A0ACC1SY87_9HYPO|nr:hypothetical protein NM208_g860 [Fusarium decemcellulare]
MQFKLATLFGLFTLLSFSLSAPTDPNAAVEPEADHDSDALLVGRQISQRQVISRRQAITQPGAAAVTEIPELDARQVISRGAPELNARQVVSSRGVPAELEARQIITITRRQVITRAAPELNARQVTTGGGGGTRIGARQVTTRIQERNAQSTGARE